MAVIPIASVSDRPERRLMRVLGGEALAPPPIWLMRQAGRYLPEYRSIRERAGSFLDLCYTPALAAEVTLQPIRRFGFDAAILFADILVVPDALGQGVRFVEGEGPRLDPVRSGADLDRLGAGKTREKFAIIAETVERVRRDLPADTALIGFCGSPWTVATYMVGGRGSTDQAAARLMAYRDRTSFTRLIDLFDARFNRLPRYADPRRRRLCTAFRQLGRQPAGGRVRRWVVQPTRTMVAALKVRHPGVPVIGFPRGAGAKTERYVVETGVDAVGCDTGVPLATMRDQLSLLTAVQGNLDPLLLVAGGAALEARVREIKGAMDGQRFVFNLGHGIVPETPPENVARLVELVRG